MMKNLPLALILVTLFATPFDLVAEPIRRAATDGMILDLGNYAQQIEVRAKSLGSGECKVEFSIEGKAVSVVAPANDYSDWVGVGPTFLSPANVKLGVLVKCDAGAITQVKYHR